jgi:hypothetical protein
MIAEAVLALEYGASSEDIARTTHAHVRLSFPIRTKLFLMSVPQKADAVRGIPRSRFTGVCRQSDPLLEESI